MTADPINPADQLLRPRRPSLQELHAFLQRQIDLLAQERQAEVDQTSLLASNCGPRLLEKKGLAIGGLAISSLSVGLGSKTLLELHLPSAYHASPTLPPHTFRAGDMARLEPNVGGEGGKKKGKLGGKSGGGGAKGESGVDEEGVEGVVSRVSSEKITLSLDTTHPVPSLPDNLRLIKLANSATYDRMDSTIRRLARILLNPSNFFAGAGGGDGLGSEWAMSGGSEAGEGGKDVVGALMGLRQPGWGEMPFLPPSPVALAVPLASQHPGEEPVPKRGIKYFDETLNNSQKEAVDFALTAEEIACIHGPPGTGKTYTLVEIIRQSVFVQKKRVLVCGASNLAVDNLLTRLSPLFPPHALLRLGHPARITPALLTRTLDYATATSDEADIVKDVKSELEGNMRDLTRKKGEKGWVKGKERGRMWDDVRELRKEHRVREAKVVKNVVAAAQVVLSTCHGAGSRQIANVQFDVCIIDEATQAVEAVCWIPILKSRKLILAGDPLQLPPTILSSRNKEVKSRMRGKPLIESKEVPAGARTAPLLEAVTPEIDPTEQPVAKGESEPSNRESNDVSEVVSTTSLRPPGTLEMTLFDRLERMYGEGIKRVLKVQYRMHESIAAFPSDTLYSSALISHESVAKRTLLELPSIIDPASEDSIDSLTPNVIFFDTAGLEMFERQEGDGEGSGPASSIGDSSKYNENEALIVAEWVIKLVELGVPETEIAVVTPYQAQVAHIRKALEGYPELSVGSVDGMQGQEREAIVLSLVRSNPDREVGFLAEKRRLNVAMTRAKRQLCIVGDSGTVATGGKYLKDWMTWLEDNADIRFPGQ